ncbi:MAG TPA: signal recognition particle-docking protein FtsY [Candidatus Nanoarchaeia archaeon]|nr:signal recognition particle-docking protein FtsY [Candidatus Nanoarchaeia archaeon]
MFSKLKEKLKSAMSVFSKKAEEEAVVEEQSNNFAGSQPSAIKKQKDLEKVKDKIVTPAKEKRKEEVKKELKPEKKKIKKESKIELLADKTFLEQIHEEKAEMEAYEAKEEIKEKPDAEEGKSFFGKLKSAFSKDSSEELDAPIEEKIRAKSKEEKELRTETEKKGFFGRVKESITTKRISAERFEELFWDLELALLENNVSVEVTEKIKEDLSQELVDKPLPRDVSKKIEESLRSTLNTILSHGKVDLIKNIKNKKPYVIAFFGVNGAGKTTSIAKLANLLKENKLKVVLAAGDTFRAAAIQQLQEHADKLEVPMIKQNYGSDAAAVAFDAIKYAEKNKMDAVLIDTAGRLHSNTNLMAELDKIIRVAKPDFKIFVGESITGNDCIEQARKFNELVQMDGAILTKVDVDDKGGAPLSISYTIGKPILFLGVGQKYKDLEEFDKDKILSRLGF